MATVLLETPFTVTEGMLLPALERLLPKGVEIVMVGDADSRVSIFGVMGKKVLVSQQDSSIPEADFQRTLAVCPGDRAGAAAAVAAHQAHAVIKMVDGAETPNDAMIGALIVSLVAAAWVDVAPVSAVHWPASDTLSTADEYAQHLATMKPDRLPFPFWVRLINTSEDNPQNGVRQSMVVTEGLQAFTGHEIEFAPTDKLAPEEMAARILGLSEILIKEGPVAKDGGEFGLSPDDHCRISFKPQGLRANTPILELSAEQTQSMDEALKSRAAAGLDQSGAS